MESQRWRCDSRCLSTVRHRSRLCRWASMFEPTRDPPPDDRTDPPPPPAEPEREPRRPPPEDPPPEVPTYVSVLSPHVEAPPRELRPPPERWEAACFSRALRSSRRTCGSSSRGTEEMMMQPRARRSRHQRDDATPV